MQYETEIVRCATCGAPLGGVTEATMVVCPYCGCENHVTQTAAHMQARARRFEVAAKEADQMGRDNEARAQALMAEHQALLVRYMEGDKSVGQSVLRTLEGYLRLQYAPTLHIYGAYGMDDPKIADALAQIDATVKSAVEQTAQRLGIETA
jgi:uncharacterized Zn finger protein (UPF0148 family)